MPITFRLPEAIEQQLRQEFADLNHAAKEATLVELYRQAKITHFELGQALELSYSQTDDLLKRYRVTEDLLSPDEHAAQVAGLRKLLNR